MEILHEYGDVIFYKVAGYDLKGINDKHNFFAWLEYSNNYVLMETPVAKALLEFGSTYTELKSIGFGYYGKMPTKYGNALLSLFKIHKTNGYDIQRLSAMTLKSIFNGDYHNYSGNCLFVTDSNIYIVTDLPEVIGETVTMPFDSQRVLILAYLSKIPSGLTFKLQQNASKKDDDECTLRLLSVHQLPEKLKVECLDISHNKHLKVIPTTICVNSLRCNEGVTTIPSGNYNILEFYGSIVELPKKLTANKLFLSNCPITTLPSDLKVSHLKIDDCQIQSLANITFTGDKLELKNMPQLTEMPKFDRTNGIPQLQDLDISNTGITEIDDIKIVFLSCHNTKLKELPDNVQFLRAHPRDLAGKRLPSNLLSVYIEYRCILEYYLFNLSTEWLEKIKSNKYMSFDLSLPWLLLQLNMVQRDNITTVESNLQNVKTLFGK